MSATCPGPGSVTVSNGVSCTDTGTSGHYHYGVTNPSSVINAGTISGTYVGSNAGVGIFNASNTISSISNSGTITGQSSSNYIGAGIYNYTGGTITTLTNSGSGEISTTSGGDYYRVGIWNESTIGTLNNSGLISGSDNYSAGIWNSSGTITTLTNSGTISANSGISPVGVWNDASITNLTNNSGGTISGSGDYSAGVWNTSSGTITNLTNSGTIIADGSGTAGVWNDHIITNLTNNSGGTISGINGGSGIYNGGTINTLTNNSGASISGSGTSVAGIYNGNVIGTLTNSGTISATGTGSFGIWNDGGTITTLTNTGTISASGTNSYGINNSGTITTFNNAQGGDSSNASKTAITYSGVLPANYNIIVNSATNYGQLTGTSITATNTSVVFGVDSSSTLAFGRYLSVFSGIDLSGKFTNASSSGTFSGTGGPIGWVLQQNPSTSTSMDLIVGCSGAVSIASGQSCINVFAATRKGLDNPTSVSNAGTITGSGGGFSIGIYNNLTGGAAPTFINSGTISGSNTSSNIVSGIYNAGGITAITNSGTISAADTGSSIQNSNYTAGIRAEGTITTITNNAGGTISGTSNKSVGAGIYANANITTITNNSGATISGTGTNNRGVGIYNVSGHTIGTVTNAGTISGTGVTNPAGIYNAGTITTLSNTGTISSINNAGTITTLNNAQSSLAYTGTLPTNYSIIINSPTSFGSLAVTSGTGSTAFSIKSGSTVADGATYASVFSSNTDLTGHITNLSGTYSGYSWTLGLHSGSTTLWDLVFASTGPTCTGVVVVTGSQSCTDTGTTNAGATSYGVISPISVTNAGTISGTSSGAGVSGVGIYNASGNTATFITNSGTISGTGGTSPYGIYNAGAISGALTNTGAITSVHNTGSIGSIVNTSGTITTLNNAQASLAYSGALPTNYSIIINSSTSFGSLAVTSGTGSTAFSIHSSSTVAEGTTYAGIFNGTGLSGKITNLTGTYSGYSWTLGLRSGSATLWDLVFAAAAPSIGNIVSPTSNLSSLGSSFTTVFDGGKLIVDSDKTTVTSAFTIKPTSGAIDQSGKTATFAGQFTDDTTGAGKLTIVNSGDKTKGAVILSGNNTYTGGTEVQSGATLQIASNKAIGTGTLTLKGDSTTAATFKPAADNLVVSNKIAIATQGAIDQYGKTSTFAGQFTDDTTTAGKLTIINTGENQGAVVLAANNTYSGGTQVQAGATLQIASASAIGTGTLELVGTSTTSANLKTTSSMTLSNSIKVAGDPTFTVTPGNTLTISGAIVDGTSAGDVVVGGVGGGGTVNLTAVNTYSGNTTIEAGNTLTLSGTGSIAKSGTDLTVGTGVINSGTFNIATSSNNTVTVGKNYTQASTGILAMNWDQKLSIAGSASLAGTLSLFNSNNTTYSLGRYTLVNALGGLSGTYSLNSSNLSSSYRYSLAYDANDAYLDIQADGSSTQQSLVNTAQVLQGTFALQNSILNGSLGYDCNLFGAHDLCLSTGGRNTTVQGDGMNNTSALLIAAYKVQPKVRIGVFADQNLSSSGPSTVKLGNNTPLLGLFAAWSQNTDGTGLEVKGSMAYGQKSATVTRAVTGDSQPGSGSSNLTTQGAQVVAKYGFAITPKTIVTPYAGLRYSQTNMAGYTEGASSAVSAPLTYQALNTNATTLLAGAIASHQLTPKMTVFASAGVESDTNTSTGTYTATSPYIVGLTPINFNPSVVKNRPTASVGTYYDLEKNQRLGLTASYSQTPFQAVSATSVMATYTIGF